MTQPRPLYLEPVQLNAQLHRHKKITALTDFSLLAHTNAVYLNVVEFPHAAIEFPIIFLPPGTANPSVTPVAMLGLVADENLYVEDTRWTANYLPAYFRRMPYLTAPIPGTYQIGIYIDAQWPALSDTEGDPLFTDTGERAPVLENAINFMQAFNVESNRTTQVCDRLNELGLFTGMKVDATMPDGSAFTVDGFLTIDENKLAELPDAVVVELHRNGVLGVIHSHLLSLRHVQRLVQLRGQRMTPAPAA